MDVGQDPSRAGKKLAAVPHYCISERLLWNCGELPQIEQISVAQHTNSPWSTPPSPIPPKKKRKGENLYSQRTTCLQSTHVADINYIQHMNYMNYTYISCYDNLFKVSVIRSHCFSFLQSKHISKATLKDLVSENQAVITPMSSSPTSKSRLTCQLGGPTC